MMSVFLFVEYFPCCCPIIGDVCINVKKILTVNSLYVEILGVSRSLVGSPIIVQHDILLVRCVHISKKEMQKVVKSVFFS